MTDPYGRELLARFGWIPDPAAVAEVDARHHVARMRADLSAQWVLFRAAGGARSLLAGAEMPLGREMSSRQQNPGGRTRRARRRALRTQAGVVRPAAPVGRGTPRSPRPDRHPREGQPIPLVAGGSGMSGIEPRRAVSGDEVDAHSRFRHYLRWRPGERAAVKRSTNRRERRERKVDAEQQLRELGRGDEA